MEFQILFHPTPGAMGETMIDKHHKNVIKFFQDEMEKFKVNGNIETEIV